MNKKILYFLLAVLIVSVAVVYTVNANDRYFFCVDNEVALTRYETTLSDPAFEMDGNDLYVNLNNQLYLVNPAIYEIDGSDLVIREHAECTETTGGFVCETGSGCGP